MVVLNECSLTTMITEVQVVLTRETDCWLLLLWTVAILFASRARKRSLPPSPLVTHCTYGCQNSHERYLVNNVFRLFNLYKHGSVSSALTGSITVFHLLFTKFLFAWKKKFPFGDRRPGLDKWDWSLRDVFNDVSKYIRLISISLNRVFP